MSVSNFEQLAYGGTSTGKLGKDVTGNNIEVITYRETWRAECDSPSDNSATVRAFLRANKGTYPWYDKPYGGGNTTDSSAVVNGIEIRVVDGSDRAFDVVYTYEPVSANASTPEPEQPTIDGGTSPDPLEWLEDIDVYFSPVLVAAEEGLFRGFYTSAGTAVKKPGDEAAEGPSHPILQLGQSHAICNSALVPYDPPLEAEKQIQVIRISRNVLEYDGAFLSQYHDTVNADQVEINKPLYRFKTTIKPLMGRIAIGSSFSFQNGRKFWRQTTEIQIDFDNWRRKPLDKGLAEVGGTGDPSPSDFDNKVTNVDDDGLPLPEPYLLDGLGRKLGQGQKPIYGHWTTLREVNWAGLKDKAW